jgi:hypothetical protein
MRVSSQTVVFRRDLRIRGLRSTIRAMDQKVNFLSTPEVSLNQLNFLFFRVLQLGCEEETIGKPHEAPPRIEEPS